MTDDPFTTMYITDRAELDQAIALHEIRAKTPVVDTTGSCLDYVLVPIHFSQAHEMLRLAQDAYPYNLCLKAQYANDDEEIHLEIVEQPQEA